MLKGVAPGARTGTSAPTLSNSVVRPAAGRNLEWRRPLATHVTGFVDLYRVKWMRKPRAHCETCHEEAQRTQEAWKCGILPRGRERGQTGGWSSPSAIQRAAVRGAWRRWAGWPTRPMARTVPAESATPYLSAVFIYAPFKQSTCFQQCLDPLHEVHGSGAARKTTRYGWSKRHCPGSGTRTKPNAGSNHRLEFELGAWFEGACGFALVLARSQRREHGLGPFGRADLHPRRNPLDRQGRFAPQPASDGSKDEG